MHSNKRKFNGRPVARAGRRVGSHVKWMPSWLKHVKSLHSAPLGVNIILPEAGRNPLHVPQEVVDIQFGRALLEKVVLLQNLYHLLLEIEPLWRFLVTRLVSSLFSLWAVDSGRTML